MRTAPNQTASCETADVRRSNIQWHTCMSGAAIFQHGYAKVCAAQKRFQIGWACPSRAATMVRSSRCWPSEADGPLQHGTKPTQHHGLQGFQLQNHGLDVGCLEHGLEVAIQGSLAGHRDAACTCSASTNKVKRPWAARVSNQSRRAPSSQNGMTHKKWWRRQRTSSVRQGQIGQPLLDRKPDLGLRRSR